PGGAVVEALQERGASADDQRTTHGFPPQTAAAATVGDVVGRELAPACAGVGRDPDASTLRADDPGVAVVAEPDAVAGVPGTCRVVDDPGLAAVLAFDDTRGAIAIPEKVERGDDVIGGERIEGDGQDVTGADLACRGAVAEHVDPVDAAIGRLPQAERG